MSVLNHITLTVRDLDLSEAFYTNHFGLRCRARGPAQVYLDAPGLWLCLERSDTPSPATDGTHIAFTATDAEFAARAEGLKEAAKPWKDNRSEGASLYVCDPDGHRLELHVGDLESRLAHYRAHPEKGVEVLDP